MAPRPAYAALALALALALSSPSRVAAATPADAPTPAQRYLDGKAALEAGRFDEAQDAFEAALAQVEDEVTRWQLLLGLAVAHELSGRPLDALAHYRRFIERASDSPLARTPKWAERLDVARRSVASAEAAVLQSRGMLVVEGGSRFAATTLSGEGGLEEPLELPARRYLAPGVYRIHATATGMTPFSEVVELHVGDRRRVAVKLSPAVAAPAPGPPPALIADDGPGPSPAWIPIGAGAALIATGGVLTGLAYSDAREVEDLSSQPGTDDVLAEHARLTARGQDREIASWVCYGVGAAALGAGVAWLLLEDDGPSGSGQIEQTGLRVELGPSGGAAVFSGRF